MTDQNSQIVMDESSEWLGLSNIRSAVLQLIEACNEQIGLLQDLKLASPILDWIEGDVLDQAEKIKEELDGCTDDLNEAAEFIESLKNGDRADEILELLAFISELDEELDDLIGDGASDEVKEDLIQYLTAKLNGISNSINNLYNVMIQAA